MNKAPCTYAYLNNKESRTAGGANQWIRFDFEPTCLHSINIDSAENLLGDFDLTWQDADKIWHTCLGSPYNLNSHSATEFSCITDKGEMTRIF